MARGEDTAGDPTRQVGREYLAAQAAAQAAAAQSKPVLRQPLLHERRGVDYDKYGEDWDE